MRTSYFSGEAESVHIGFGTESASPEVLQLMNKRHQRVDDIDEAARKCGLAGIRVGFNLIFGYPGEEDRHRRETLRVMAKIGELRDNVFFSPNLFTPYPGIPIWPELRERGLEEPDSLADWARVHLGATNLPWLRGRELENLRRCMSYFQLDNRLSALRRRMQSRSIRLILGGIRKPLQWRLRHSFFEWPLELQLSLAGSGWWFAGLC